MFERYRKVHFVGIGGIGMSGIAEVLHNLGYEVTGSDVKESETIARLKKLGITVFLGHQKSNIEGSHVIVLSSAIGNDNPEVMAARGLAIPAIPRAEMLAELGRLKYSVLVAGAHGKTTTTSLIATIISQAGLDPTLVIGGRLIATGSNARMGQGMFMIAEADESDGSFLKLSPTIAVVTNIDREHMDFFKTMDTLKEAFVSFINKVPFYGLSIVCWENEHIREILPKVHRRCLTYGLSGEADVVATDIVQGFLSVNYRVTVHGKDLGRFTIPMPGTHNVLNSLAAVMVGLELKIDPEGIRESLKDFRGIQRRFELKGEAGGIRFFDDYGHHPAEIRATLKAAREALSLIKGKSGRVVVLFQPHRYTRTRDLLKEFGASFGDADLLYIMDIYAAGEEPVEGINASVVLDAVRGNGHPAALYISDPGTLIEEIGKNLRPHDLFITIGAGNVWKRGEELLARKRENG